MFTVQRESKGIKRQFLSLLFILSALLVFSSCSKDEETNPLTSEKFIILDNGMQKLWADHMQYTYVTVDAFFNNPEALQAKLDRLLINQEDIGAAIVPYYGQAAGDQLTTLLKEHITDAVPVLVAAKSNDQEGLNIAVTEWRRNAKEIADFLSAANPDNWESSHIRMHMDGHITQTISYSVDLLQHNYSNAIIDYDIAFDHMMGLASTLSRGIAKQFPDKF